MRRWFVPLLCVILSLGVGGAVADDSLVLQRFGLDDTASLALKIASDTVQKVEGKASLKITAGRPTTVGIGEVDGLDVEAAKLVFSARVKTELEGEAYLEMWVQVGGGNYFSKGLNNAAKGKGDWKTIQTPFFLQKGQRAQKAVLNLVINGKGTVWIDDAVLARAPLK